LPVVSIVALSTLIILIGVIKKPWVLFTVYSY
jgi:hypothetical protein